MCPGLLHASAVQEIAFYHVSESADGIRIELDPRPAIQLLQGFPEWAPSPIWTIAGDSVKGIGHR